MSQYRRILKHLFVHVQFDHCESLMDSGLAWRALLRFRCFGLTFRKESAVCYLEEI